MFFDTRPAPTDSMDEFRLTDAAEIRSLLKALMDRNVVINLSASDGTACSSTLWSIDGTQRKLSFSVDPHSPSSQRLVEAEEATAVAYLDQVKLQFEVASRVMVHSTRSSVMQAAWPMEVFRFQRRAAYRVRTLERTQPVASLRHPQIAEMLLELRVLDVSIGGCALFLPHDTPTIEPGITLKAVRIALDADTEFMTSLTLHHITAIQPQAKGVRLGCEFGKLDAAATRALQRYIDSTQKRRRMLSLD